MQCYPIILKHLKGFSLDQIRIIEHDASSVIFQSPLSAERLIELRYFTNVHLIVNDLKLLPGHMLKGNYFRLMLLKAGVPRQMQAADRSRLESSIETELKLVSDTHRSRNNFYAIERSDGTQLLTLRLAKAKFKREELSPGELRPELAHILCLVAGLKAKYTVLDPFAGFGAIPLEAIRGFGCKQVIAVDAQQLPNRHIHPSVQWYAADARRLDFLPDNSVDRVVTDPPWGLYDAKIDDLSSLYVDTLREVARILRPDGVVVMLSGYDQASQCLEQVSSLKLLTSWKVLISGKKAVIYKLQKVR